MRGEPKACIADMDAELHDFLACVEALVPVSVVMGLLKTRLLGNSHDVGVALANLFLIIAQSVAL